MRSKDGFSTVCSAFFTGALIGFLFGFYIAASFSDTMWKDIAVDRGYAQYNQTTGDWEWKDEQK